MAGFYKPWKSHGFERATQEIIKALKIVRESHALTLARHWVATDSHRPSVIKDAADDDDHTAASLKISERLVRKTHETYEPHFCRNIGELGECSFLAIILKSIHTQDAVDYVLEFLWPQRQDCLISLELLLLTLKTCLPSFVLGSGAQLGDELRILDVDNVTRIIGSFKIFQGKGSITVKEDDYTSSSSAPKHNIVSLSTSKKRNSLDEQGPKPAKKMLRRSDRLLAKKKSSNNDDEMLIVAQLKDKMSLFHIPCASKLADLKKEIGQQYSNLTNYNLTFLFGGGWCVLNDDEDLENCFEIYKEGKQNYVQVRVDIEQVNT